MTFLLDVNVLMALLWENHEHHQVARTWFRDVTDFGTCPVSQLGFARVSSHPALGYSMSPDQAFSVLRGFLADARHHFVPDDLSCEDRVASCALPARQTDLNQVRAGLPPSQVGRFAGAPSWRTAGQSVSAKDV